MPGSISLSWATGRMMLAPLEGCCFISSNSSGVSEPGFFRTRSSTPILPDVVQQRGDAQPVELFGRKPQLPADGQRILGHAPGMAAGVRILFVNGGGEHADRAEEQLA